MKEKERKGRDGGSKKEGKGVLSSVVPYSVCMYVCLCTLSGLQSIIEMGWDETVTFWSRDTEPITPSS